MCDPEHADNSLEVARKFFILLTISSLFVNIFVS